MKLLRKHHIGRVAVMVHDNSEWLIIRINKFNRVQICSLSAHAKSIPRTSREWCGGVGVPASWIKRTKKIS